MKQGNLYLLDTNIVSELTRSIPNQNVVKCFITNLQRSAISVITWYELIRGLLNKPEGKSKEFLKRFYYNDILKNMDILPYVINVADVNSFVNSRLVSMGRKPSLPDSMIAATAIVNNLTLVTRNVKDFQYIADIMPLKIENWFVE